MQTKGEFRFGVPWLATQACFFGAGVVFFVCLAVAWECKLGHLCSAIHDFVLCSLLIYIARIRCKCVYNVIPYDS